MVPKIWRSLFFVGLACAAACALNPVPMPERSVQVSYSLPSPRVSLGEPVMVVVEIRNDSDQSIIANLGTNEHNLQFIVSRPGGARVQVRPPQKEGFTDFGLMKIEPGQMRRREVLLNEWFSFDQVGDYQLDISLLAPVLNDNGGSVPVEQTGRLRLNIAARDEAQMRVLCHSLLRKIAAAKSYDQAESPAKLLGAIRDPVAVPFLAQATGFWHLAPVTVPALERIGDSSAVDALILMLRSAEKDRRVLARSSLMRIESRTADTNLKEKVERALREPEK